MAASNDEDASRSRSHEPPARDSAATAPLDRGVRVCDLVLCVLAVVGLTFRFVLLDSFPAVNGDEAWYGVQSLQWLQDGSLAKRTPTGNLVNWLFLGPLTLLHLCGFASTATLRAPSLAAGLLALPIGYFGMRRAFDAEVARTFTFILAILPVNIAYCRFAWDASETLPAIVAVLSCACIAVRDPRAGRGWFVATAAAFGVAYYVHPTNIFLLPVVVTLGWRVYWEDFGRLSRRARHAAGTLVAAGAVVGVVLLARSPRLRNVGSRLTSASDIRSYLTQVCRFVTGDSLYDYISREATPGQAAFWAAVGGSLLIGVAWGLYVRIRRTRDPVEIGLAAGLGLALAGFYAVAGAEGVRKGFERYLIWFVAPGSLAAALAWRSWAARPASRLVARCAALVVAALLLGGMATEYFGTLWKTGGSGHLTFRLGRVDPKHEALDWIDRESDANAPAPIVSRGWWTRWALEYRTRARGETRRVEAPEKLQDLDDARFADAWFVELVESDSAEELEREFAARKLVARYVEFRDRSDRPVVGVWRAERP